ncbi:MAG: hypothetical protein ACRD15_05130 [Vicinamibacterales bacterium]
MSDDESEILVDSYGADSPLIRLAQLASPACRIEPQLLRHLRLDCVPDADVSVEQELWHSELVNERGKTITFCEGVVRVLRERLKAMRAASPTVVARARSLMADLHRDLPPLLILEDELAWAEVFGDSGSIASGAQTLLTSLLARREGLDYWLGRAWNVLPADLKRRPEGHALSQVAAARGARVDEATPVAAAETVAHVLPLTPLPLKLHGLQLDINVKPSDATHTIEVPQMQRRVVSVLTGSRTIEVVVGPNETKSVHLNPGTVVIRTLAGAEYELEVSAGIAAAVFEVELLPAGPGASVMIAYGEGREARRILVDCGDRRTGRQLVERLRRDNTAGPVELLVLTHIDDGHIGGAITLLESIEEQRVRMDGPGRIRDIWFNRPEQLPGARSTKL